MRTHGGHRGGHGGWSRGGRGGYGYGWNAPIVLVDNTPQVCETVVNGKSYYGQYVNGKCVATNLNKTSSVDGESASVQEMAVQPICTTKKTVAILAVIATSAILYSILKKY